MSTRSGLIVKGHGRLLAAELEEFKEVPVEFQNYESDEAELADLTADNRIAELAEMDTKMLTEIFADIDTGLIDFELTGYTEQEYEDLVAAFSDAISEGLTDPDDVPEIDEENEPINKHGDVWLLGLHRLMCGDSTSLADVKHLMDGQLADMLLTDPPYNVGYEGKTKDKLTILNDSMENDRFRQFLCDAFYTADSVMKAGAVFYIWHADSEGYNFRGACSDVGWQVRQCLIWNKNSMVLGRQDYHWKHEPCLYGWKEGAGHLWASDRKQTTVIDWDRPNKADIHPTMKPVGLFDYQIQNNTNGSDIVLDLFGGSGTTLIAAEQTGRKCRMMELDPKYCDVIVRRWMKVTGRDDIVCIRDGKQLSREEIADIFTE